MRGGREERAWVADGKADFVTHGAFGGGVIELVDAILEDELAGIDPKLAYKGVVLGKREDNSEIGIVPYGVDAELSPGDAAKVIEHFSGAEYQLLIVDPKGSDAAPAVSDLEEALRILASPRQSATLTSIPTDWNPVAEFYARTGRPLWLVAPAAVQPPAGVSGSVVRVGGNKSSSGSV